MKTLCPLCKIINIDTELFSNFRDYRFKRCVHSWFEIAYELSLEIIKLKIKEKK